MYSFREWVAKSNELYDEIILEAIGGVYTDNIYNEVREDIESVFNSVVTYASYPTTPQSGKFNWYNVNYSFWSQPKNKANMINNAYHSIIDKIHDKKLNIGDKRAVGRNLIKTYITSQWQKDVGFGSRRFVTYASRLGHDLSNIRQGLVKPRPEGRQIGTKLQLTQTPEGKRRLKRVVDPHFNPGFSP